MSEDSDLELPSSDEIRSTLAKANSRKNRKVDKESDSDSSDSVEFVKVQSQPSQSSSPEKFRRNKLSLCISESVKEKKYREKRFSNINNIFDEILVCTACNKDLKLHVRVGRDVYKHPVLGVLLCEKCSKFYGDGDFSIDEDGSDKYCRWCGQGGTLYCCSKCTCAFCKACVKRNLKRSILTDIEDDSWLCFVCAPEPLFELRGACATAQTYINKSKRKVKRERTKRLSDLSQERKIGKTPPRLKRADSTDDATDPDKPSTSYARSDATKKKKWSKSSKNLSSKSEDESSDDDSTNCAKKSSKPARASKSAGQTKRSNLVEDPNITKESPHSSDTDGHVSNDLHENSSDQDWFSENMSDLNKVSEILCKRATALADLKRITSKGPEYVASVVNKVRKLVTVVEADLKNIADSLSENHQKWETRAKKRRVKCKKSNSKNVTKELKEDSSDSDASDGKKQKLSVSVNKTDIGKHVMSSSDQSEDTNSDKEKNENIKSQKRQETEKSTGDLCTSANEKKIDEPSDPLDISKDIFETESEDTVCINDSAKDILDTDQDRENEVTSKNNAKENTQSSEDNTYFEKAEKEKKESSNDKLESLSDASVPINVTDKYVPAENANNLSASYSANEEGANFETVFVNEDTENQNCDMSNEEQLENGQKSNCNSVENETGSQDGTENKDDSMKDEKDVRAKAALLASSSDEDVDKPKNRKKRKRKKKIDDNTESVKSESLNSLHKKQNNINNKDCDESLSDTSSFLSSEEMDPDCPTKKRKKLKKISERRKKLKLEDTEAYRNDEKLRMICDVNVTRLAEDEFQESLSASKAKSKNKENLKSLFNLNSLTRSRKNPDADNSDNDNDSSKEETALGKQKTKKRKKKETETSQELENNDESSDDTEDVNFEAIEAMKAKEEITDKLLLENEDGMAKEALLMLVSSSESEDEEVTVKEKKKMKNCRVTKKSEENKSTDTDLKDKKSIEDDNDEQQKEIEKEQDKEKETDEEKEEGVENQKEKENKDGDTEEKEAATEDDSEEELNKRSSWKRNKLLCEKLSETDVSEEEERWNRKREKGENEKDKKKKVRRRVLHSNSDTDFLISSDSDNSSSESIISKSNKKKAKSSGSSGSDSDQKTKKKTKLRRIKAPANDSSSEEGSEDDEEIDDSQISGESPVKGRKNIRKVMKDKNVAEATKKAAKAEEERLQRIMEKQKLYNALYDVPEGVESIDKLVLDFDPESKEELVSVHPEIVKKLKPHQVKGIKFMWDACFESLEQIKKNKRKGSGCILAHCMGLGKTFQVVALIHTLLTHENTKVNSVLIVCPLSTVSNWVSELHYWPKETDTDIDVYELTKYKQNTERSFVLKEWQKNGGVMVMGYDMFRNLVNTTGKRMRKKVIESLQTSLLDPGPDLVVCDEGHLLKNEKTALSKAMTKIRTLRRIVLTGTPLQNNLKEYHCMVQFVKPNLLGTLREFQNRFVNPIHNGQFENSTSQDVKVMKRRAHVLHKMLEGSVQRFDYSVLTPFLPPKHEYVISIMLSDIQIKIYQHYLDNYAAKKDGPTKGAKLFSDFQALARIWTHPRVLLMSAERNEKLAEKRRLEESDSEGSLRDFIDDSGAESSSSSSSSSSKSSDNSDVIALDDNENKNSKKETKHHNKGRRITRNMKKNGEVDDVEEVIDLDNVGEHKVEAWWREFIEDDHLVNMKYSGKLILLFNILEECESIGDKILVFSQSIFSLDLIEYYLNRIDEATQKGEVDENLCGFTGRWSLGLDYFRLDGSTPGELRTAYCKNFNDTSDLRSRLFLISTRAGGLGINLYAANRVIIFDASWNPSHDVQSIFRVYRFGQKKPCYIYRFLAHGTMEEKIYERQVTKLSLACRVVDEQQIERHYNMNDLQELYTFSPEKPVRPTPAFPKDRLLADMLSKHENWIDTYHEHDSLLENQEEEELNEEERKAAWEEYENEKKGLMFPATQQMPGTSTGSLQSINPYALKEAIKRENPQATEEQVNARLSEVLGEIMSYFSVPKLPQINPMGIQQKLYTDLYGRGMYLNNLQQQQQQQVPWMGNYGVSQSPYYASANPLANPNLLASNPQLLNRLLSNGNEVGSSRPLIMGRNNLNPKAMPLMRNPFAGGTHRPGTPTNISQEKKTSGSTATTDIQTID